MFFGYYDSVILNLEVLSNIYLNHFQNIWYQFSHTHLIRIRICSPVNYIIPLLDKYPFCVEYDSITNPKECLSGFYLNQDYLTILWVLKLRIRGI